MQRTLGAFCFFGLMVCLLVGSVFSLSWAQDAKVATGDGASQPLVNVLTIERHPFVMMQNGKLVGFSIDLWDEVSKSLGVRSKFELATSFADMLKNVADGKADAAIANITITSEREQLLDFFTTNV